MARSTRRRIVPQTSEDEVIIEPINAAEIAQAEADAENDEVGKLKGLIKTLQDSDPEGELTISIRTRINEFKPWHVLDSRKLPVNQIDIEQLIRDVQTEFGDGNYKLVFYYRSQVFKNYDFSVGDPRKKIEAVRPSDRSDIVTMLPSILQMQRDSSDKSSQMMLMMMQQSSQASERMTQMMMGMMTALIPAISGNKTDVSEVLRLAKDLSPPQQANGLGEILDNAAKLKGLIGDGGSGDKATNIWDVAKEVGPALGAVVGPLLEQARSNPSIQSQQRVQQLPAGTSVAGQQLQRPQISPPQAPSTSVPQSPQATASVTDPLLALIADEVVLFARKGYPPELAADTLADILEHAGVSAEQLQSKAMELMADPAFNGNWLEALASRGVDLRPYPEWTQRVLELVSDSLANNDIAEGDDNPERDGGGDGDPTSNGGLGERGEPQS